MVDNTISATLRTEFGKGAARRVRREGLVPAVLYGHGTDPVHLNLPGHDTFLIVRHSRNALLTISFDGKSELALVKDVQINPVLRQIEHLDLVLVRRGEKVLVDVPVELKGESFSGTIAALELQTLPIEVDATDIPESIVVNIDGLEDGTVVRVSDVKLPAGATTDLDPESPVVVVSTPRAAETPDEAAEDSAEEPAED